jgi:Transcriptional regulatory protein, C terminal
MGWTPSCAESGLVELLIRNQGRIVPSAAIVEAIWGDRREVEVNTVDAFVRLVRRKVDDAWQESVIHASWCRPFGGSRKLRLNLTIRARTSSFISRLSQCRIAAVHPD